MEFIENNKGSDSDQHKVFQPKLQENFNIYKLIFYQVGILSVSWVSHRIKEWMLDIL
jgi:hypothetical protein